MTDMKSRAFKVRVTVLSTMCTMQSEMRTAGATAFPLGSLLASRDCLARPKLPSESCSKCGGVVVGVTEDDCRGKQGSLISGDQYLTVPGQLMQAGVAEKLARLYIELFA